MSNQPHETRVLEREVIVAAQRGDRAAFKAIYEAHQERIYNTSYYMLNDPRLVEDVVQTVFLKILRGLPRFRFEADLSTWIYQITVNECQNQNRRRPMKQISFESLLGSGDEVDDLSIPENQHALNERQAIIRRAVLELSPKLRTVVVLKYIEGLSYDEMADVLGCAAGTVASRLNRALARLEQRLRPLRRIL
jgi:RNA polymerase sigma-70 factor (ECF subfamily)